MLVQFPTEFVISKQIVFLTSFEDPTFFLFIKELIA